MAGREGVPGRSVRPHLADRIFEGLHQQRTDRPGGAGCHRPLRKTVLGLDGETEFQIRGTGSVLDVILELNGILSADTGGIVPHGFVDPGPEPFTLHTDGPGGEQDGGRDQLLPGEPFRARPQ